MPVALVLGYLWWPDPTTPAAILYDTAYIVVAAAFVTIPFVNVVRIVYEFVAGYLDYDEPAWLE